MDILLSAGEYLKKEMARGKNYFLEEDFLKKTGKTNTALKFSLIRLRKQKIIATPTHGYHLIIPPKYEKLGCLPADEFINSMMNYLKVPYYIGLLSAAAYYGATHQAVQVFYVMAREQRKDLRCGQVIIKFVNSKKWPSENLILIRNSAAGYIKVSCPELTCLDLVSHMRISGGINFVATVLKELLTETKKVNFTKIVEEYNPSVSSIQRLGYLVTFLGFEKLSKPLNHFVEENAYRNIPLVSHPPLKGELDRKWKIFINTEIETDI